MSASARRPRTADPGAIAARVALLLAITAVGVAVSAALIAVQPTPWAWLTPVFGGAVIACIVADLWVLLSLTDATRR